MSGLLANERRARAQTDHANWAVWDIDVSEFDNGRQLESAGRRVGSGHRAGTGHAGGRDTSGTQQGAGPDLPRPAGRQRADERTVGKTLNCGGHRPENDTRPAGTGRDRVLARVADTPPLTLVVAPLDGGGPNMAIPPGDGTTAGASNDARPRRTYCTTRLNGGHDEQEIKASQETVEARADIGSVPEIVGDRKRWRVRESLLMPVSRRGAGLGDKQVSASTPPSVLERPNIGHSTAGISSPVDADVRATYAGASLQREVRAHLKTSAQAREPAQDSAAVAQNDRGTRAGSVHSGISRLPRGSSQLAGRVPTSEQIANRRLGTLATGDGASRKSLARRHLSTVETAWTLESPGVRLAEHDRGFVCGVQARPAQVGKSARSSRAPHTCGGPGELVTPHKSIIHILVAPLGLAGSNPALYTGKWPSLRSSHAKDMDAVHQARRAGHWPLGGHLVKSTRTKETRSSHAGAIPHSDTSRVVEETGPTTPRAADGHRHENWRVRNRPNGPFRGGAQAVKPRPIQPANEMTRQLSHSQHRRGHGPTWERSAKYDPGVRCAGSSPAGGTMAQTLDEYQSPAGYARATGEGLTAQIRQRKHVRQGAPADRNSAGIVVDPRSESGLETTGQALHHSESSGPRVGRAGERVALVALSHAHAPVGVKAGRGTGQGSHKHGSHPSLSSATLSVCACTPARDTAAQPSGRNR